MRIAAASALRLALVAAVAALALRSAAEKKPYERYQSIVDRQPFGALPAGFDPMRNPDEVQKGAAGAEVELTQEQGNLQKSVQFSVINIEEDGSVMVGFTDKTDAKMPQHYYIAVGDTRDGWFVKEADPSQETMTVVKDGIEISLELGANSAPAVGSKGGARGLPSGRPSLLKRGGGAEAGGAVSFRGRRAAREAREAAEREAREAAKAEAEAREAEEKARREAEKAEREAEREEQREQLMTIREELRRAREEKAQRKAEEAAAENAEGGGEADE